MPTPQELCATPPAAASGVVTQARHNGADWRKVFEIADVAAGVWHDVSCYVDGADLTRGAPDYLGRFQAAIANIELAARDDRLAPWNPNTAPTFGVHVALGAGLLFRGGWTRVDAGVVAEWRPRFTHRVETWTDVTRAGGNARIHQVVARDLLTELNGVPLANIVPIENWYDRAVRILTAAGYPFGWEIYGARTTAAAAPVLNLPSRPQVPSALAELDATFDPVGIVWSTSPTGKIIARPGPGDTFHADLFAAGAAGDPWVAPPPVVFSYQACDDGRHEFAFGRGSQFGIDDTELQIVNHVRVTDPDDPAPFDYESPVSISRYGRKTRQFSWLAANDTVATQVVDTRDFASRQARPLLATIDMLRFFPDVVDAEWLDPVTVWNRTAPGRTPIEATGRVRRFVEKFRPRHPNQAISYSKEIVVDVDDVVELLELLPVTGLAATTVNYDDARFGWANPAQPIAPTETWVRVPQQSLLWLELDYPMTELAWLGLDPATAYQFDVRLVRRTSGLVTHVSPVRSVTFTTAVSPGPVVVDPGPGGGGGGVSVVLPDVDDPELCDVDWVLSKSSDGATWTEVDSGTAAGGTQLDFGAVLFEAGLTYRLCSTENCGGVLGTTYCTPVIVPTCQTTGGYPGTEPYDRPDILVYIPEICSPDVVVEAVTQTIGQHGPAWGGVYSIDVDKIGLASSTAAGGVVAYGEASTLDYAGSATIEWVGSVQTDESALLFSIPGLRIRDVDAGVLGWYPSAQVTTVLGDEVTVTDPTARARIPETTVRATYDAATGILELFVNGSSVGTGSVEEPALRAVGNLAWSVGLPAASYLTVCAAWASVVTVAQPPTPTPTVLGFVTSSLLAGARSVRVSGSYAYVVAPTAQKLVVVDISAPAAPVIVGSTSPAAGKRFDFNHDLVGGYCYIAGSDLTVGGLSVVNISTPSAPSPVGFISLPNAHSVAVSGSYAYVSKAGPNQGLYIVNISTPSAPSLVGSVLIAGDVAGVAYQSGYAYVADIVNGRVRIFNVSTPSAPVLVGGSGLSIPGAHHVVVDGSYMYVACGAAAGLYIVDISTPSAPVVVSTLANAALGTCYGLHKVGGYVYICGYVSDSVAVVDVSNPASPSVVGSVVDGTNLNGAFEPRFTGSVIVATSNLGSRLTILDI